MSRVIPGTHFIQIFGTASAPATALKGYPKTLLIALHLSMFLSTHFTA